MPSIRRTALPIKIVAWKIMIVHDILHNAANSFETAGIPSARLDAEVLLAFCLKCERLEFFKNTDMTISKRQLAQFRALINRRLRWEPVAYLTGRKDFWTMTLEVNKDVLIPRPDTEIIVEEALDVCSKTNSAEIKKILDVGTGSGAIAIALAREIALARIVATDISAAALTLAKKNVRALKLENVIDFRRGDLFEPVEGIFDVIACNPPYMSENEYKKLPAGVKDYEPAVALLSGKNGTEFCEKLIYQAPGYLKKNGWLLLEIGAKQEKTVRRLMEESGFYDSMKMRRDYSGLPRVMKARRK
ncbi:MAG: peptide chain release factor N(5)-glutamine methyltransferase [Syntrophaceae bacterium]|nr:peptide chain release factor N(5)-glutamine methyltransferase [Syntrophaceae bacterium]